jgi:hypothetical protein
MLRQQLSVVIFINNIGLKFEIVVMQRDAVEHRNPR